MREPRFDLIADRRAIIDRRADRRPHCGAADGAEREPRRGIAQPSARRPAAPRLRGG